MRANRLARAAAAASVLTCVLSGCANEPTAPGEILFHSKKYKCINCHIVAGRGGEQGPDLSDAGEKFERSYLLEYIPDARRFKADTKMPPFPDMPQEDLQLIVGWLLEQR